MTISTTQLYGSAAHVRLRSNLNGLRCVKSFFFVSFAAHKLKIKSPAAFGYITEPAANICYVGTKFGTDRYSVVDGWLLAMFKG